LGCNSCGCSCSHSFDCFCHKWIQWRDNFSKGKKKNSPKL